MIDWIHVNTRLPKKDTKVLAYIQRYDFVSLATYRDSEEVEGEMQWWLDSPDDESYPSLYPVTAWAEFNYPTKNNQSTHENQHRQSH